MSGTRSVSLDADFPIRPYRMAALAAVGLLTAAWLSVLYHVVDVVGGVSVFLPLVAAAIVLAAVFRALGAAKAAVLAVVLLAAGLVVYVSMMPDAYAAALSVQRVINDTVALLTGFSVLRMTEAGAWALAVTPGPVFLAWYFAFRGEYGRSVVVGGLTLGFFVLTGDSGTVGTMVGVLGAFGAVGFGTLDAHRGRRRQVEVLAAVLGVAVLASATVSAVPGSGSPLVPASATAPEGSLVAAGERVGIGGSISLSPEVQFVVEADQDRYWRAGVYDRFTGQGWVRTSAQAPSAGLHPPPGQTDRLRQTVTVKRPLSVMPAAASPVDVRGAEYDLTVFGNPQPEGSLDEGDSYSVVSAVPASSPEELRRSGTDYPREVATRYGQVPASTSDQVRQLTGDIVEDADTPYAKAEAIERWLETNKGYSLTVPAPDGNLVNQFLLDMEKGYCVYYASAMTVMLRTQGIPARYAVGYTSGQRVSEDTWVVRGVDSHAWVEVYFPDRGWVAFDPTPGSIRETNENRIVDDARERGVDDVDAAGSEDGTWTPTPTSTTTPRDGSDGRNVTVDRPQDPLSQRAPGGNGTLPVARPPNVSDPAGDGGDTGGTGGDGLIPDADPETVVVWTVLVAGLLAGIHRFGVAARVYRALWLHTRPRGSPADRVTGAYARVEYVLERHHRPRKQGETVREYLDAIRADRRASDLADLRERATYAEQTSREDAERATRLAAALVAEYGRLPFRKPATVFNRSLP